jgi:hypothetical protein
VHDASYGFPMPEWNLVGKQHVLAAIAECDRLGSRDFLQRYRFGRARASTVWHRGQEYDSKAILGVAYLHATGRAATADDFTRGEAGAVDLLQGLGFDVVVDEEALAAESQPRARKASAAAKPVRTARASTAAKPRRTPKQEERVKICPTCFMALPATGICDNCD